MNTTSRILGEAVRPPTERELMDPWWAYRYATCVIKHGRWPEGEPAIAKDPECAQYYLKQFPEAKLEWLMNGWMDWTDL